jgi:osmotically-inducible protein OsmY
VPTDRIKVKVENGWVTLSGDVDWNFQRLAASDAVRKLGGVVGVRNDLFVKPKLYAADVKKKIEDALKRNAETEASAIRVSVTDGRVTLDGKVRAWSERQVAEQAAWSAPGVAAVVDHLQIG